MRIKGTFAYICLLCTVALALSAQNAVKILDWSWSNPDIDYLEKNISRMNAECPLLDGLTIRLGGTETINENGEKWSPNTANAWSKRRWKYEYFEDFVARFKKLDMGHFTDNFLIITTTNFDFDWLDDDDCAIMTRNFGIAARVAKECGCKGLAVDIEEYGRHFWRPSDLETDKTAEEIKAVVFRRGQEWGHEVFSAFPDIILFMPFCLSMTNAPLSIAFMNGVIDVIPPSATIYEGLETSTYAARFCSSYNMMQDGLRKLIRQNVRHENRKKARGQILLAPGFYLDAYFVFPKGSLYHEILEPEHTVFGALDMLARCFAAASLEAEPYIWLYGEKRCWWKDSRHPKILGTWDEAPDGTGLTETLMEIKNPQGIQFDSTKNLVPDHDFQNTGAWDLWQQKQSSADGIPGSGTIKDGKASMVKVTNGCFNQLIPCKPGQLYLFAARACVVNEKSGSAKASLCFRDSAGKWLPLECNIALHVPPTGKEETILSYVLTPGNATEVSIQCGAEAQQEGGEIFFTGIYLEEK